MICLETGIPVGPVTANYCINTNPLQGFYPRATASMVLEEPSITSVTGFNTRLPFFLRIELLYSFRLSKCGITNLC